MQRNIYYKPSEAARILDCDPTTIIRYIRDRKIRALITHTGRFKIPEMEIDKYKTECEKRYEQMEFDFGMQSI